jgi:uncharacterized membrane protein YidH (DUF202 family)
VSARAKDGAVTDEPGTARERTRLSWRRTALAVTVVAVLTVRLAGHARLGWSAPLAVPGWLIVLAVAHRRARATAVARPVPPGVDLPIVAAAVAGFALLGIGLVVLP